MANFLQGFSKGFSDSLKPDTIIAMALAKKEKKAALESKLDLALAEQGVSLDDESLGEIQGASVDERIDFKLDRIADASKSRLETKMKSTKLDQESKELDIAKKKDDLKTGKGKKLTSTDLKTLTAIKTIKDSLDDDGKRNFFGKVQDLFTKSPYEEAVDELGGVPEEEITRRFEEQFGVGEELTGKELPIDETLITEKAPKGVPQEAWDNATDEQKKEYFDKVGTK